VLASQITDKSGNAKKFLEFQSKLRGKVPNKGLTVFLDNLSEQEARLSIVGDYSTTY
jgi:hypothetical protein